MHSEADIDLAIAFLDVFGEGVIASLIVPIFVLIVIAINVLDKGD